jgi:hypothetical protein
MKLGFRAAVLRRHAGETPRTGMAGTGRWRAEAMPLRIAAARVDAAAGPWPVLVCAISIQWRKRPGAAIESLDPAMARRGPAITGGRRGRTFSAGGVWSATRIMI